MFIERNESGDIVAVYASEQPGRASEQLAADAPEVLAFYERLREVKQDE
jgi:hypothetical protein